jgi:hypothetical protein
MVTEGWSSRLYVVKLARFAAAAAAAARANGLARRKRPTRTGERQHARFRP